MKPILEVAITKSSMMSDEYPASLSFYTYIYRLRTLFHTLQLQSRLNIQRVCKVTDKFICLQNNVNKSAKADRLLISCTIY